MNSPQTAVHESINIRPLRNDDRAAWQPLWDGYNAFYGRAGATALDPQITLATWQRLLDPDEPMFALVAAQGTCLLGLAHFLFHRSTTRVERVCYLKDLYTDSAARGQGLGAALVRSVCERARAAGARRVYWHTHESNASARRLYDRVGAHNGFIVYGHDG